MPSEWTALLVIVLVAGGVAMFSLPTFRRVVIIVVCVPIGGFCALQMDDRASGIVLLTLPTLILLLAAAIFGPFKSKRVEALSALASVSMLWIGFMGVLLVLGAAWRNL